MGKWGVAESILLISFILAGLVTGALVYTSVDQEDSGDIITGATSSRLSSSDSLSGKTPQTQTYIISDSDSSETETQEKDKEETSETETEEDEETDSGESDSETEIQSQITDVENDKEDLDDTLDEIEEDIDDADDEDDIEDIDDDLGDAEDDLEALEDSIRSLKSQLRDEEGDNADGMRDDLDDLEEDVEDLLDKVDDLENDLDKKEDEITAEQTEDTDADNDGVEDSQDVCSGYDDTADADSDGTPDGCDTDDDNDGVSDSADICSGYDDTADTDGDGTPDGCDNSDDTDSDGDGIADTSDVCSGYDDTVDSDGDGTPDGCDTDDDNDGVDDSSDVCVGYDDSADADGDGTPDGCDPSPLSDVEELLAGIMALEEDIEELNLDIYSFTEQIPENLSDEEVLVLAEELNDLYDAVSVLEETLEELYDDFQGIDEDDFVDDEGIDYSHYVLDRLEDIYDDIDDLYETLDDTSGDLLSDVQELLAGITALEEDVEDISTEIDGLAAQITEALTTEEILALSEELNDVYDDVDEVDDALEDLYDDFNDIDEDDFTNEGIDRGAVQETFEVLDASIDSLSTQIEELLETLEDLYSYRTYELCNQNLYLGENVSACEGDIITGDDFELFADGTYDDSEGNNDNYVFYTQTLEFQDQQTGQFIFTQDDDDAPTAQEYLFIDNGNSRIYNYSLTFEETVLFDATSEETAEDDLVGTTIVIQDAVYTLIDISLSDTNSIDEISLVPGITENTEICSYSIDLTSATSGSSTNFRIDTTEARFNSDSSEPSDQLEVSIDFTALVYAENVEIEVELTGSEEGTIRESEYLDEAEVDQAYTQTITLDFPWDVDEDYTLEISICPQSGDCVTETYELTISVEELETCELATDMIRLRQGDETQSGYVDIDGTLSLIDSSEGTLNGFSIAYAPDTDEVYLSEGDKLIDPTFGQFAFLFTSIENDEYETLEFIAGSISAEIRFMNNDGRLVELPLAADSSYTAGESADEPIFWGNEAPTSTTWNQDELVYLEGETCTGPASVVDCQGAMFLVIDADGNAHLVQITNIDTVDDEMNFDDLTYSTSNDNMAYTDGSVTDISLTSADIQIEIDESAKTVTFTVIGSSDGAKITTYDLATLEIMNADTTVQIYEGLMFSEYNDGIQAADKYLEDLEITAAYDNLTDNTIEWQSAPLADLGREEGFGWYDESDEADDYQEFMTWKGTLLTYDRENQQDLVIKHPTYPVYAVIALESS